MTTHFYRGTEYLKGIQGQVVLHEYDMVKLDGVQYYVDDTMLDLDHMILYIYLQEV